MPQDSRPEARASDAVKAAFFPEMGAGGFTRLDGTVEFYGRINALISPQMSVLDFGAGRAAWNEDDPCPYRRALRTLKGKVARVVGCDVDAAVRENRSLDESVVMGVGEPLPFPKEHFDLVIADYVFEHIDDPERVARELERVVVPGGWICARTPNRWGYVSILTRLIHNRHHARVLSRAQPDRKAIDVFPTRFGMNTQRKIRALFPPTRFEDHSYLYEAEPGYFFGSRAIFFALLVLNRFVPRALASGLHVFLRKR